MGYVSQGYFIDAAFFVVRMLAAWTLLFLVFRFFMGQVFALWLANGVLLNSVVGAVYLNAGFFIDLYEEAGTKELLICQFIALNTLVVPLFYWLDKQKAKRETATRIPEANLHVMAYIGGAAGSLVAQSIFRHKTTKAGFRRKTWLAMALNVGIFYLLSYL